MLVVAILVTAVLTMATSAQLLSGSRHEYTQALYLGEGGIDHLISTWRLQGADTPLLSDWQTVGYYGELAGGSYHVMVEPHPTRSDLMLMTSEGTTNNGLPSTVYNLTRTVQVQLDTDGDWAWNHVYYSDVDSPEMDPPLYADINGNGDVEIDGVAGDPEDFLDSEHGPMGGGVLPSPMWDVWHDWVQLDLGADPDTMLPIPRDPDGDGLADPRWPDQATLPAVTQVSSDADPDRHTYWYGSSSSTPLGHASHSSDSHAGYDENDFMPDWYGVDSPEAYICNTSNKRLTVTFGNNQAEEGVYVGNYLVHGDIEVKQHAVIQGTLIATGNITFYGVANVQITPEVMNPDAPCEERVYYPALIAGQDVLIRDQGKNNPGDPNPTRLRTSGVIWAGNSYTGSASDVEGCVVSPSVTLGGNFMVRYGFYIDGCYYEPGAAPPPWFREPDRGAMQPLPRSWREVGL
jgi:hypothetical protein